MIDRTQSLQTFTRLALVRNMIDSVLWSTLNHYFCADSRLGLAVEPLLLSPCLWRCSCGFFLPTSGIFRHVWGSREFCALVILPATTPFRLPRLSHRSLLCVSSLFDVGIRRGWTT